MGGGGGGGGGGGLQHVLLDPNPRPQLQYYMHGKELKTLDPAKYPGTPSARILA